MVTKHMTAELKSVEATESEGTNEGSFTGYASVFGNVDSYGDVVVKGAFAESLADYGEDGAGVPCYWGHQMSNPMLNIGVTRKAVETDRGLYVEVKLDMSNPNAAYVHKLIKEQRVRQMSFAFDVEDGGWGERDGEEVYELRKLKLHEVSVVPIGANQETELIGAKARQQAREAVEKRLKETLDGDSQTTTVGEDGPELVNLTTEVSGSNELTEPAEEQEAQVKAGGNPAVVLAHVTLNSF